MNDHAVMILLGIASVATAISGFSGVVAVFAGRTDGKWAPAERFRTTNMLILSLGACLLSFVPLTGEMFQISNGTTWMFSSLLLGLFCAAYFTYTIGMIRKLNLLRPGALIVWVGIVYFICLILAVILQVINAVGILTASGPGPFIAGLILMLVPAGLQFAFLVLTPLTSDNLKI